MTKEIEIHQSQNDRKTEIDTVFSAPGSGSCPTWVCMVRFDGESEFRFDSVGLEFRLEMFDRFDQFGYLALD